MKYVIVIPDGCADEPVAELGGFTPLQAAKLPNMDRVAKAGTFLQFGVSDYATTATISPYRIYNQEITITGSMAVLHSYERAAELFAAGVLDPQIFISHRMPLAQYPQALEQFAAGQGRKIVVRP